jgi:predicted AlkP superfamily phosphohydrolase/phosphomutase
MTTVLFGLDGATFTVLDHLMALGDMPHLQALLARGSRALLRSTPMPITPQAWTSLATGRGAGQHGIHDFVRLERGPQGLFWRVNDARDNQCETIWHIASRHNRRVTVLNYFGMAPPRPLLGHSMPGFTTGRHLRRSSYPADLFARLEQVPGFDVKILGLDLIVEQEGLQELPAERWSEWIGHHVERDAVWFAVLEHLLAHEPSELAALVLDGVDKIQHLAYRYLDPAFLPQAPSDWESGVIALCRRYFRQVDACLGRLIERVLPEGRLFVVSDHGFTASTEIVYINTWLHEQGYLCWNQEVPRDAQQAMFSMRMTNITNAIDLSRTKAFALTPSCNGVYLNVPQTEYQEFRDELSRRLLALRGPDGGQVITEVKKREEWFPGPLMERIPDLTLTLRDFGLISILNGSAPVVRRTQVVGTHHPDGIFVAAGQGIRAGQCVNRLNILDVAPALLYSLGLEIPAEFEGRLPEEIFEPEWLASQPPRAGSSALPVQPGAAAVDELTDEERNLLLERLRNLGYLE